MWGCSNFVWTEVFKISLNAIIFQLKPHIDRHIEHLFPILKLLRIDMVSAIIQASEKYSQG